MDMVLEQVIIDDRLMGGTEITGYKIADVSTQRTNPARPKARWGRNRVFKLEGGGYVLVREAFSLVYHKKDTRCRTANRVASGEQATVTEMGAELDQMGYKLGAAVSCEVCQPTWPEDLKAAQLYRFEFPRRTIDQCEDRAQVTHRLTSSRKFSGVTSQEIPEPTRDLLAQCGVNDPDWYASPLPTVQIR